MAELVKIRGRNVFGRLREIELVEGGAYDAPGSRLRQRLVVVKNRSYVYKCVPRADGNREPALYDMLDNEVRAGTRLGQVYADRYPPELARLAAYNVDAEEPFVLFYAYAGDPATGLATRLEPEHRRLFEVGLLRAVRLTAEAGVIHGALTMDALRWDGRQVQLVNFESARQVGEPRRSGPVLPSHSPEQSSGSGTVDKRDDVWAACLIVRDVAMGASANGFRRDRSSDPEWLRALLDPVFDNEVAHRPEPADLLRGLRSDVPELAAGDPEAGLTPGQRQFDRISLRKRRTTANAGQEPANRGTNPRWGVAAMVVLVVIAAVVGLAVMFGWVNL
ncbi:hypothetical protein [Actinophytocola sp.]|uniref:hypothetical protein n=1 Tax=Actinophytocola sp. TaxID=1872138 RepID=UPI002ED159D8